MFARTTKQTAQCQSAGDGLQSVSCFFDIHVVTKEIYIELDEWDITRNIKKASRTGALIIEEHFGHVS